MRRCLYVYVQSDFAGDDVDMLSLPESDGFTDEAVVADTEGTAFGDESS